MFDRNLDLLAASRKRKLDSGNAEIKAEAEDQDSRSNEIEDAKFVTGVPLTTMPGHTGFLTFATLPPKL